MNYFQQLARILRFEEEGGASKPRIVHLWIIFNALAMSICNALECIDVCRGFYLKPSGEFY
jgi:hypothetical protein